MHLPAIEITTLWGAFIFGLAGSLHCLGMCGPLLALAESVRAGKWKAWSQLPLHLGRLITYSLMGLLAGLAGGAIEKGGLAAGFQGLASLLGGAVMICLTFILLGWIPWQRAIEVSDSFVGKFANKLSSRQPLSSLVLGLYWGFLPCGLVWAALMAAIGSGATTGSQIVVPLFGDGPWQLLAGSAIGGMLVMFVFGLGTVPALLVIGGLGGILGAHARIWMHRIGAIAVMLLGVILILRGASSAGWIGKIMIVPGIPLY